MVTKSTFGVPKTDYALQCHWVGEPQRKNGRPRLSVAEKRTDRYLVLLNDVERRLLQGLSGKLGLRAADLFREGLLALERELANGVVIRYVNVRRK